MDVQAHQRVVNKDVIAVDDAVAVLSVLEAGKDRECDSLGHGVLCELELVAVLAVFCLRLCHLEVGPRVNMLQLKLHPIDDYLVLARLLDSRILLQLLEHLCVDAC